ncbi:MAG: hypothetical protein PVI86_03865 [Phycisphaerae bacterium]
MNKNLTAGIVCAAVVVLYAIGWTMLPSLQRAARGVDRDASVQVERARRLLHQYDPRLAYKAVLTDDLVDLGFELDPDEVSEDLADEYQQARDELWGAYEPQDRVGDETRPARPGTGNFARQIDEGMRGQDRLVEENDALLDAALTAVEQALAINQGDESSRFHAEATRLKSTILYQKGMAARVRAQLYRRLGTGYRRELIALASEATESVAARDLIAASNIDIEIEKLRQQGADIERLVAQNEETLRRVDGRIATLEEQLAAASARRDQGDAARRKHQSDGIDFTDPNGPERYREQAKSLSSAFRAADRETKQLMYGSYPNAEIDASQDYVSGRYVEGGSSTGLTTRRGLVHERNDRAVLHAKLDGLRRGAEAVRAEIGRLETMRQAYAAAETEAARRIKDDAQDATDVYEELNRIDSEAFAIEDNALELLGNAAEEAERAAEYTSRWLREGRDRADGASPDASPFAAQANARWMTGFVTAQIADACLAKAWVYYDRYNAYSSNAKVLTTIAGTLGLDEADSTAEQEKAQDAHDRGVEEIAEAMNALESAHGEAGRHWTITAQAAGTAYLMALFGHDDYVADAVEGYRKALQGREDADVAKVFAARLSRLEQR